MSKARSSSPLKTLHVTVVAARGLHGAGKVNAYGEGIVLDTRGQPMGRSRSTQTVRLSTASPDPQWDHLLAFQVDAKVFSGLMVRVWDKHTFRRDRFLGQVTIKFNTDLLEGTDAIDQWFELKQRGKKESVSGSLHLRIHYGDIKEVEKAKGAKEVKKVSDEDDASDEEDERDKKPLALSQHYHKADPRLERSTHVQVDEDDVEDDDGEREDEDLYEPARKGKPELTKLNKDSKVTLSSKNLEVANTSSGYGNEAARGVVGVNSGRWYYEVKLPSYGQVQVGWCTTSYTQLKRNQGDAWTYDITNAQTMRKGNYHQVFGARCNQSDVIGVGIDIEAKTISFWRNGSALGEAWTDVALPDGTSAERFHPYIELQRNAKSKVNFGKEPFSHPQVKAGYHGLHCLLSDSEMAALAKLFNEYKAAGVDLSSSADAEDAIQGNGTLKLQEDLGAVDDDDPLMMVVAWKLNCQTMWEISRQEFMDGFSLYGCHTLKQISDKAQQWKKDIKNDDEEFKSFYYFVFNYLRGQKKILDIDSVELVWDMLIKPRGWGLYNDWMTFLKEKGTKAVSKDTWQQLWEFMATYPSDLSTYDELAAWPLLYDEFAEWWREKQAN